MSTILKALRRLEQDKDAPVERPLRDQVAAPDRKRRYRRRPRRRWGVVLVSLVLGTVAGAGILLGMTRYGDPLKERIAGLLPGGSEETTAAAVPATPEAAKPAVPAGKSDEAKAAAQRRSDARAERLAAAKARRAASQQRVAGASANGENKPRPRRKRGAPQPAPELPPGALASEVAVIERPERPKPSPQAEAPAATPESGGVAKTPEAVAARAVEPPKPTPAPPKARPEPAPESEPEAPVRTASVSSAEVKARHIVRARVPEVFVARTVWHPQAARRIALVAVDGEIDRVELHEGDAVGPLVVERIEPSGVYFNHDGVAILRRVGAK